MRGGQLPSRESTCTVVDVLRDDGSTRLERVEASRDGRRALVKRQSGQHHEAKSVCLFTDYEVVARDRLGCALPFEDVLSSGQEAWLLFHDPGGEPLDRMTWTTFERWVEIAADMVQALCEIHGAGLLHRDIRPDSFLVAPDGVYVADFSRAIRLRREHRDLQAVDPDIERLRYISPELTGRFNRAVDCRSDYYSLGAVLYRMLTGVPPFTDADPHYLVYQHLAVTPQSPREIDADVPEVVAQIVLRLLEKDPDRRYQGADEILDDLHVAREVTCGELEDDGALVRRRGDERTLDVTHRLYGRDDERQTLLDRLERAFAGRPQVLLISGQSGIGKTTLIRETYVPVTRQCAFYVAGKFDQMQGGAPYSAWLDALESLVEFVLAESADGLAHWRARMDDALGEHAAVLAPFIPSLHTLLGDLPALPELPPSEAKTRFKEAFVHFFEAFGKSERPLVVFLDDLQWMDSASVELLETLGERLTHVPLLLIGAYRDNEVSRTHPLQLTLTGLREQSRCELTELALRPLSQDDVTTLLAEGARRSPSEVQAFASELMRRTGGNPFFLWQFLRTMRDNHWLTVDPSRGCWDWDLSAIQEVGFADNVVDLTLHRFRGLPPACRQLLCWAACLGKSFDLEVLGWLAEEPTVEIYRKLGPAVAEEFILPLSEPELVDTNVIIRSFRFFHDRMQEAAYRALPEAELAPLHQRIANLLRRNLSAADSEARVIEIAGHQNRAVSLITETEEALDLARLNLWAARKAKTGAAYAAALEHMRLGMSALPDDVWSREPDLAYELYALRGELEYLNSDFEQAEWFIDEAIRQETDRYRRADLYHMRIVQNTLRARYGQAVATARHALSLFGEELPVSDFERTRDHDLAAVEALLQGRSLRELGELPPMQDPDKQAVMKLLIGVGPPCYRSRPRLWSVIVARQVRLCLEHGVAPGAVYSFPAFGGLLTHVGRGGGAECADLDQATRRLMDRFADPANSSVGYLMMGSSLHHWFAPFATASQDYLDAYRSGQASGNLQYAAYGFGHNTYCRLFRGDPLDELIPDALDYLAYSQQRGNLWGIDLITGALRVFQLLYGEWANDEWPYKHESEHEYLARCAHNDNLQVLCIYHMMRASALLQWGEVAQAAIDLIEAEKRLDSVSVQGLLPATQFPVLKALVLLEDPGALDAGDGDIDRHLAEARARYDQWRVHAPDNFEHWYQWLVAEEGRRAGDLETVLTAYDAALQAAHEQSAWPAVALIARRADGFWQSRGRDQFAGVYRQQRHQAVRLWRALAVHAAIEAEKPASAAGSHAVGPRMDAVIQIAQALSLHTELSDLVPEIIRNVARQTGAQRVALLLARDDELRLAMDSGLDGSQYHDAPPALDSVEMLPRSAIRYVARTQRPLRFSATDMEARPLLGNDEYLRRLTASEAGFHGALWCVPLTYLGELLGVLYLEHQLTADAFDERQDPLVEFLAAQAAISMRNIELMRQLREEGQARREAELRKESADAEILAHREETERLEKLANTDPLTSLPNRRWFMAHLEEVARHQVEGQLGLMMLDIDHFKHLNDVYGHAVGDEVLSHFARILRASLRAGDLAARLGGEEFAILLRNADVAEAVDVAQRLAARVAQTPVHLQEQSVHFTVSIGVDGLDAADDSPETALQRADDALYRAKGQGRNQVCTGCQSA